MRRYMKRKNIEGVIGRPCSGGVGMTRPMVEEMYRIMAIANYEERFVIPTTHRETAEDAYELRGGCGFTFGNGCAAGGSHRGRPGQGGPAHPHAAFQPAAGGIRAGPEKKRAPRDDPT